jgi:tRNA(Ile)-lysidine synthase
MSRKLKVAVPKQMGGVLIRRLNQFFKRKDLYHLTSHIHIACSGGSDSVALALLVLKYGRKIRRHGAQVTLIHFNHGWRGRASELDLEFVRALAHRYHVPFFSMHALEFDPPKRGQSLEEHASRVRHDFFERILRQYPGVVLTAHTADDQYENMLIKFFTGAVLNASFFIHPQVRQVYRPFLECTREELREFLSEEKQKWREDQSNKNTRFLRNAVRLSLVPVVQKIFPGAKKSVLNSLIKLRF